jgi:hypothetical protein
MFQRNITIEFDLNAATRRFAVVWNYFDIFAMASHGNFDHFAPCTLLRHSVQIQHASQRRECPMPEQLGFWSYLGKSLAAAEDLSILAETILGQNSRLRSCEP